jgi:hypothetical protein
MTKGCIWKFSGDADPEDKNKFDFGAKAHHDETMNRLLDRLGTLANPLVGWIDIKITGTIKINDGGKCQK